MFNETQSPVRHEFNNFVTEFTKTYPAIKKVSKSNVATFLWIVPAVLYNPENYKDINFVNTVSIMIKKIKLVEFRDFVLESRRNSTNEKISNKDRFMQHSQGIDLD